MFDSPRNKLACCLERGLEGFSHRGRKLVRETFARVLLSRRLHVVKLTWLRFNEVISLDSRPLISASNSAQDVSLANKNWRDARNCARAHRHVI